MCKNKHLTNLQRQQIEQSLKACVSIKRIALNLGKSTSTISREIRKHAVPSNKTAPYRIANRCTKMPNCTKRYLCSKDVNCTKLCKSCKLCNNLCNDYEESICQKLSSPPYVCNGCTTEHLCVLRKKYYLHQQAHKAYHNTLVETRVGANISENELVKLDTFVSPLICNGQSIHHITINNPNEFTISEKTLYRYVAGGLLKARNIDMPRVCRLKPRSTKPIVHKVDKSCRIGRTFDAYRSYLEQHADISVVEMDTVIGRIGGSVLLTIMFKSCDLMLAFIRDRNTSQSVIDIFNYLYDLLGAQTFQAMFPVILTDNGSEFSNPLALELDNHGVSRTSIFYCDPCASYQKPNVELNHEFIRKILPKGYSFDNLTQNHINLMMSHINSYSREKLNNRSPYDVFGFLYGNSILESLGLTRIPANNIILKPHLINS